MQQDSLWASFLKTGRVEDYLRYRGIDIYARTDRPEKEKQRHEADDRRPHHPGKQQYW